ncbi:hypothetical protein [Mycobacterium sp. ZZG]
MTVWLSQHDFAEHGEEIAAQIRTILASKGKTRRRFCVIEVREKSSGHLLGEVVRTTHGLVVVFQTRTLLANGEWSTFRLERERMTSAVTGDPAQSFRFASRSAQYWVSGETLLPLIESGAPHLLLDQAFIWRRAERPASTER